MPKRGDNIRKRKDGRWEGRYKIVFPPSQDVRYRSVYGKTYGEVKKKLLSEKKRKCHVKREELFFSELLTRWMNANSIRLKGATRKKYQFLIDTHINPELGNLRLSQINSAQINMFLDDKLADGRMDGAGGLSPSYVRSITIIIGAAIKYAVAEELCMPLKTPIFKPAAKGKSMPCLSSQCRRRLEENCLLHMDGTSLGILLALHAGLRIGEICALRWEDIDTERRILSVRHTIARVRAGMNETRKSQLILDQPKTKTSLREIPINSFLLPLLERMRADANSSFVISEKPEFVSPRTFEYRYHSILKRYNIDQVNFHALRHSFATYCIERGVDDKTLSEILGHASVSITLNTYVHSTMEQKKAQIEKIVSN